jgi:UDP-2,4-diacetamido-2,4,6-trideoxy-beta-L-altropyranose hydrolase
MRILFRTEANHAQGMGDLWGCLAIADQASQQNFEVVFLVEDYSDARELLVNSGYEYQTMPCGTTTAGDLEATLKIQSEVIVVNKLRSSPAYVGGLRSANRFVVTVDDDGEAASFANLRINPLYPTAAALTSFKYLMLRSEFQELHKLQRQSNRVSQLLVMQGGADTYGFLPKIARAMHEVPGEFRTLFVLGPAFQHHTELVAAINSGDREITMVLNPLNLSQLMASSDLAITAGGLSMFELACVGTPSLVVCAERFEVPTAERLETYGAVRSLGFGNDVAEPKIAATLTELLEDGSQRATMAQKGREIVDGRGAERIVSEILSEYRRN